MAIPQKSSILPAAQESIRKNLKFATLSFLFIIAYVNVFQKVFGAEKFHCRSYLHHYDVGLYGPRLNLHTI